MPCFVSTAEIIQGISKETLHKATSKNSIFRLNPSALRAPPLKGEVTRSAGGVLFEKEFLEMPINEFGHCRGIFSADKE